MIFLKGLKGYKRRIKGIFAGDHWGISFPEKAKPSYSPRIFAKLPVRKLVGGCCVWRLEKPDG